MNTKYDREVTSASVRRAVRLATAVLIVSLGSTTLSSSASAYYWRTGGVYGAPYLYFSPVVAYGGPYGYYGGYGAYGGYDGRDMWMRRASRVIDGGAR